ncbi:hypothetical protein PG984_005469 [Apiospora sp. TS-2023a]
MEVGTDRKAGRTKPGDNELTLHPKMHEESKTAAIYLGFDSTYKLHRCIFFPVVIQITRLLYPLLADPYEREHLDKVFAWFVESKSDAHFRTKYTRSAREIMAALYGNTPGDNPSDRKATAIACLLVWAYNLLSRIQNPSSLNSQGSGALETEGAQYDSLIEVVYGSFGSVAKRSREKIGETLEEAYAPISHIIPFIRHYIQFYEHEFEKYCRIIVLVRLCARTIFDLADTSRSMEARISYERDDDIMYPDGETAFDKEKRIHFRSLYNLSDMRNTEEFIGRLDKPFWMRSLRTWLSFLMVPSTRRVHSTEDLLWAEANPIEPEKCLFKNLIRASAPVPVDYIPADVGQLNWADVMCWQQDFLRHGERRQLASLALFHGHFEESKRP